MPTGYVLLKKPSHIQQVLQSWQKLLGFVKDPCACGKESVLKVRAVLSSEPVTAGELLTPSAPVTPLLSLWHSLPQEGTP